MKHMRKILALALALVMVMGLAITASAAEGETGYTVTIKNATGHTYQIYQIFTGDLYIDENDEEILSNIKYGADYTPDGVEVGDKVPDSVLEGFNPSSITTTGTGTAMTVADGVATATGLVAGYYMIKDTTAELPEGETASAVIFQVVGDTTVTSKHDATPITEKKIDDKNDSTGAEDAIVWHDSADHDIGDLIDFQLSAVIPSSIEAFREANQKYPFIFHDVEEQGLTFSGITAVYVLNGEEKTDLTGKYTLVTETEDGCTFEVKFEDLGAIEAIEGGSKLVVEYRSELNTNAVIGEEGNVNKMRGEYRNYNEPETPAYTPWDNVIAFTYKVVVNKVDKDLKHLSGAEFTLEKFVAAADGEAEVNGVKGNWVAKNVVKADAGDVFTFEGLDDGYYRLTETKAPDGYNKIEAIEFTVTADHDILWETQGRTDVLVKLSGNKVVGEIEFEVDAENEDALTADVVNKAGVVLPETGGIGTTIFYILGGLLAVVAVVLLVTKKRMKSAE